MTNEAHLEVETEFAIPFACADGAGIEKGAVLMMSDLMTVATATGDGDVFGGIAAEEKIAGNGVTSIAVYRGGIFKVLGEGSISVGDQLMTGAATGSANALIKGTNAALGGIGAAIALETATDGETLMVELRPGCAPNVLA